MENAQARWLWYPGDLEKYHALKQNFSRVERGCPWPAFWKSDGFRQRVAFRRTYRLEKPTSFTVFWAGDFLRTGRNQNFPSYRLHRMCARGVRARGHNSL